MGNNASKPPGEAPLSPLNGSASTKSTSLQSKHSISRKAPPTSLTERHHTIDSAASSPINTGSESPVASPDVINENSKSLQHNESRKDGKAKATPVKVPRRAVSKRQKGPDTQFEASGPPRDPNFIPHSNFGLPPRMPLPIVQEFYKPGSPPISDDEASGPLPRQSSITSNATNDEDDEELGDALQPYGPGFDRKTVSTRVNWKQPGDKVYVTGTFTLWNKKYRMERDSKSGYLSTELQLTPGTHHIKFIVDGNMQLSNELPTAVDYTNILVNYIEVSADELGDHLPTPEETRPPKILPQGTEAKDYDPDSIPKATVSEADPRAEHVYWGRPLPPYLIDMDKADDSNGYRRSNRAIEDFPVPPTLPSFLGKSILNGVSPMKDDNSVLNMPNHTVLNHLATSSIKNEVLATSITTRYNRKYVTTVVYKPTEDEN